MAKVLTFATYGLSFFCNLQKRENKTSEIFSSNIKGNLFLYHLPLFWGIFTFVKTKGKEKGKSDRREFYLCSLLSQGTKGEVRKNSNLFESFELTRTEFSNHHYCVFNFYSGKSKRSKDSSWARTLFESLELKF